MTNGRQLYAFTVPVVSRTSLSRRSQPNGRQWRAADLFLCVFINAGLVSRVHESIFLLSEVLVDFILVL
jgi:hypothetical protein